MTPELVSRIESADQIDGLVRRMVPLGEAVRSSRAAPLLRGEPIGHALHPVMTDLPIGCWTSAILLDLLGGATSRRSAQRLVGAGVLAAVPAALTGISDWSEIESPRDRRVGAVHAAGNTVVVVLYAMSWRARRRGNHLRGVLLGLVAGSLAGATGYLGGHLAFARGVGDGERGAVVAATAPEPDEDPSLAGQIGA